MGKVWWGGPGLVPAEPCANGESTDCMRLHIEHHTSFAYDQPIVESASELRLQPVDLPDRLRVERFLLTIDPPTPINHHLDYFGNHVHAFTILESHARVTIIATSDVQTGLASGSPVEEDPLRLADLLLPSRFVVVDAAMRRFVAPIANGSSPIAKAEALAQLINGSLIYETGVTDVSSTSHQVLDLGRGVCQDFAHLMLAGCRVLDIPARYISGYLYGGPETETHDRASHAWCEIYGGPAVGWVGFDPTHDTIMVDERYVRIGSGRDYGDVAPVRGTYRGNAHESLSVSVRVVAG